MHGNHLRFRRTRIKNAPGLYGRAGRPFVDVFIERIQEVVACAVAARPGHLEVLEVFRLEADSLRGHEISRIAVPGIAHEHPAIGVAEPVGQNYQSARARCSLRWVKPLDSKVHRSGHAAGRHRQYVFECQRISGVVLVVLKDLIVRKCSPRQQPEVHSEAISIHRDSVVFVQQISRRRTVEGAERGPNVHVVRITQPEPHA